MTRKHCSGQPEFSGLCCLAGRACIVLVTFVQAAFADVVNYGKSVAVQPDGKIVAAGYAGVGSADHIAVVRYNADGSLDKSFNVSGKVITAVGGGYCKAETLVLQSNGKIVVAGYSFNPKGTPFSP